MKFKVSVIIPTFGRPYYLQKTLECLAAQGYPGHLFQVVIVNSGTDPETEQVIDQARAECAIDHVKIPQQRNRSLNRRVGAEHSRGEILLFLDNDMLVPPDFIAAHAQAHEGHADRVVMAQRQMLQDFDPLCFTKHVLKEHFGLLELLPALEDERAEDLARFAGRLQDAPVPWTFLYSHNLSVKKDFYDRIGGFDPLFGENWGLEDVEIGLRFVQAGGQLSMLEGVRCFHQPHGRDVKKMYEGHLANAKLFTAKHRYAETELHALVWGLGRGPYFRLQKLVAEHPLEPGLERVPQEVFEWAAEGKFQPPPGSSPAWNERTVVFGVNQRVVDGPPVPGAYLGACTPYIGDKAASLVHVHGALLDKDEDLFGLVCQEAFRVGRAVSFDVKEARPGAFTPENILRAAKRAGVSGAPEHREGLLLFRAPDHAPPVPIRVAIPTEFAGRERYIYASLALALDRQGVDIQLQFWDASMADEGQWAPDAGTAKRFWELAHVVKRHEAAREIGSATALEHSPTHSSRQVPWVEDGVLRLQRKERRAKKEAPDGWKGVVLVRNPLYAREIRQERSDLHVIDLPVGVDPSLFRPRAPRQAGDKFVFQTFQKMGGFFENGARIVRAYVGSFNRSQPVKLHISLVTPEVTDLRAFQTGNEEQRRHMEASVRGGAAANRSAIVSFIEQLKAASGGVIPEIDLTLENLGPRAMADRIAQGDCVVAAPSRFSWETEVFEALAMGKTAVVPRAFVPASLDACHGIFMPEAEYAPAYKALQLGITSETLCTEVCDVSGPALAASLREAFQFGRLDGPRVASNAAIVHERCGWDRVAADLWREFGAIQGVLV